MCPKRRPTLRFDDLKPSAGAVVRSAILVWCGMCSSRAVAVTDTGPAAGGQLPVTRRRGLCRTPFRPVGVAERRGPVQERGGFGSMTRSGRSGSSVSRSMRATRPEPGRLGDRMRDRTR